MKAENLMSKLQLRQARYAYKSLYHSTLGRYTNFKHSCHKQTIKCSN